MYILRCPNESCQQPVFSQHPLKADRAVSHFKACGVPFKKVSDLVSLYADVGMCYFALLSSLAAGSCSPCVQSPHPTQEPSVQLLITFTLPGCYFVVVPERPSRPLTRKWAKEHNETLIGVKEDFLHAENIWPGVDESDADELH